MTSNDSLQRSVLPIPDRKTPGLTIAVYASCACPEMPAPEPIPFAFETEKMPYGGDRRHGFLILMFNAPGIRIAQN
jgi:hypothetical protein